MLDFYPDGEFISLFPKGKTQRSTCYPFQQDAALEGTRHKVRAR